MTLESLISFSIGTTRVSLPRSVSGDTVGGGRLSTDFSGVMPANDFLKPDTNLLP